VENSYNEKREPTGIWSLNLWGYDITRIRVFTTKIVFYSITICVW